MLNDVPLRDLQLFCLVVRHASFLGAAQASGVTQASVSKRIKQLETALGVKLLHRTTRKVKISEAGTTVYQYAQALLEQARALEEQLAGARAEPTGALRVSSSQRLGRRHIAPLIGALQQAHPGLLVWLELMDRRVDLIEEGFDIDIRVGEVEEPGLIPHHIASTPRILCASPAYLERHGRPRTPTDLANHDCMVFRDRDEPFGTWKLKGPDRWETVNVTGSLASNDSEVALRWCLAGHGIVMMADWNVRQQLGDGRLVRVLSKWSQPADVWAVTVARTDQSAKVRVCIDYLRRELREGPYALNQTQA